MSRGIRAAAACLAIMVAAGLTPASGQTVPITFKYVPKPGFSFVRVFLPGTFNNWGPNSGGMIVPGAPSQMTYDPDLDMLLYRLETLSAGSQAQYKLHFHLNSSGTDYRWESDPANPLTNPSDNNNSVLNVTDPMIFELDYRLDAQNRVTEVSAGIFGSEDFAEILFSVNGDSASNGLDFFDPGLGIFRYPLSAPAPSNSLFELTAIDASGDTVRGKIGSLPPMVEDAQRPPGIEDGINFDPNDLTTATLSLFAPHKSNVYVIGDFNDWEIRPGYLMKRDSLREDSVYFWLTLDGLSRGTEYAFQYLIDGQIRVGDPYSHKILDPNFDASIGSAYPGLKPYPTGKTDQIVSILQTGQQAYEWEAANFERPPVGELIIYELLVRDFIARHDYATLVDTLDYLQNLGINAIELMPVAEFNGNINWGYEPNFHLAADKYYGPARTLKRFVDECHKRGIAVLLDVVYNHNAYEAPFSRMYNTSPVGTPGAQPTPDNPWLNPTPRHPFNVFNDVNHESTATKYWLDRANEYWLTEFNVDGFRFDLSKGFTQFNSGNDADLMARYDASRIAILERMADHIWSVDSTAIVILEHFAEDSEQRELAAYGMDRGFPGMLIWQNMNYAFNEATMGFNGGSNSNFSGAYFGPGGNNWTIPHLISYMESHDEQWLMYKNLRYGACAASPFGGNRCNEADAGYNVRDVPIALDRMKMAGTFFLSLPGPHMIWQFGELGYGYGPDGRDCLRPSNTDYGDCPEGTPARTLEKPIRWNYLQDPLRYKLYRTWSELLRLRRQTQVLRDPATQVSLDLSGSIKRLTLHGSDMDVAIIGNFGVSEGSDTYLNLQPGTWYDFFYGGRAITIGDPDSAVTLAPGEFHLLTSLQVDPAEDGLITVSAEGEAAIPATVSLGLEAYPNPFGSNLTIGASIPDQGPIRIEAFDILGRRVATVVDDAAAPGYRVFDAALDDLPAGMYYLRLSTRGGQKTVAVTKAAHRHR